jgi:RNA polymerase sigma-70 factor (ECF subfamily)
MREVAPGSVIRGKISADPRKMTDSSRSADAPVTDFLHAWSGGDREALDAVIPLVHHELKRLARRRLARERPNHTIQPTALVNEAYVRLVNERGMKWRDRAHFMAVAAQLMRFILVDHARRRHYQKRGGGLQLVALDMDVADAGEESVLRVDQALSDLAKVDERKARVVELRVFGGLSVDESARLLGVSVETIGRDWKFARAWLQRELTR